MSLHVEVNVQNANPSDNPSAIVARVIIRFISLFLRYQFSRR